MRVFLDRGSVPPPLFIASLFGRFAPSPRLLALLLALTACASDPEHPPEWKPSGDAAVGHPPKSCGQIRAGEPAGPGIVFEGAPAACAAPEMVCALGDVAAFDGVCDAGEALARCSLTLEWLLDCSANGETDAGAVDSDAPDAGTTD